MKKWIKTENSRYVNIDRFDCIEICKIKNDDYIIQVKSEDTDNFQIIFSGIENFEKATSMLEEIISY